MIGSLSGTGFSGSTTEAAYYFDGVRSASGGDAMNGMGNTAVMTPHSYSPLFPDKNPVDTGV